jgi:hypothetical protein
VTDDGDGFYRLEASSGHTSVSISLDRHAADRLQKDLESLLTLSEIAGAVA